LLEFVPRVGITQGTVLAGKYEVVRAIVSGGFGSIFEARVLPAKTHRVALKQMMPHLMEGEQAELFKSKFRNEVVFLRSLSHPGIPRCYDAFADDGLYYIVMEFVVGRNLDQEREEREQLTGEHVPTMQLINDSRQVLEILHYLHSQKPPLVHRDIKPANLIREHPSGRIKVVDFGLARVLSDPNKTQTQLGTLGYSPLEQLRGKAEQRSDLYALGATMFHLVTGKAPEALNIPPVLRLRPDLNPALAAIIDRACAQDIDVRFANAKEMLGELEALLPPDSVLKMQALPRLDDERELRTYTSADRGKGRPRSKILAAAAIPLPEDTVEVEVPLEASPAQEQLPMLDLQDTLRVDVTQIRETAKRRKRWREALPWLILAATAVLMILILIRTAP
jgi:serine/threonine protein kinase